ncbi:MAG TPA: glycosyltransferase family 4 protein [Chloroflexota bacterium]|nr:glycosyltransferase family 4 protein [Chloroflexota bacterium]
MSGLSQRQGLTIRHLVPALGRVPQDLDKEGASGLVGGAISIARAQVAQGNRVELYGWRPDGGRRRYQLDGVEVRVTGGWPWARTPRIDARVVAPLLAMSAVGALGTPIDVAHAYSDPHLLLVPRARLRTIHYQTPIPEAPAGLYRRLVGMADLVICCSNFIRQQFLARLDFPPQRVAVVYNGVDLERFPPRDAAPLRRRWGIGDDEVVLLFVGAVVPQKGLLPLLQALGRVCQDATAPRCRLVVAGGAGLWPTADDPHPDGTDSYSAAARDTSQGLPVTWLGVVPQEEMPEVYAMADLFVCPSVWDEPFGTVNVEAMAAGTPVVASRAGGIPEAIAEGETGILVPPGDVEALAGALLALIGDPDRRRRMGQAARERAAHFTWRVAAHRLDRLYCEILSA